MKTVTPILLAAVLLIPALYLGAQEANQAERTLQEEMSELNVTMKQIASLLRKHVEGQETDLLIKRVELTSRTLLARKEELRKARAKVLDLGEEETHLSRALDAMDDEVAKIEDEDDTQHEYARLQLRQIDDQLKSVRSRRSVLERRIIELENSLMTQEEDVRILEDALDERLGLR